MRSAGKSLRRRRSSSPSRPKDDCRTAHTPARWRSMWSATFFGSGAGTVHLVQHRARRPRIAHERHADAFRERPDEGVSPRAGRPAEHDDEGRPDLTRDLLHLLLAQGRVQLLLVRLDRATLRLQPDLEAGRQVVEALEGVGIAVTVHTVEGDAFREPERILTGGERVDAATSERDPQSVQLDPQVALGIAAVPEQVDEPLAQHGALEGEHVQQRQPLGPQPHRRVIADELSRAEQDEHTRRRGDAHRSPLHLRNSRIALHVTDDRRPVGYIGHTSGTLQSRVEARTGTHRGVRPRSRGPMPASRAPPARGLGHDPFAHDAPGAGSHDGHGEPFLPFPTALRPVTRRTRSVA
jgi:hypothetical protein